MPRPHVSSIVRGAGLAASIWTAVDKAIQSKGGTDEDFHRLATPEGEELIDRIADLIVEAGKSKKRSRIIGVFHIACEGRKTSELVTRGQYRWVNPAITDERFLIQLHLRVRRTIVFVECDYEPSFEEVLEEFLHHGLKRPTHEDALEFGIQYPAEQRSERPYIFPHEPVLDADGNRIVLALIVEAGFRVLDVRSVGGLRYHSAVFAGVREEVL